MRWSIRQFPRHVKAAAIRVDAGATQRFSLVTARGISKGQRVHENPRRCHTVQGGRAREGRASGVGGGVELPGACAHVSVWYWEEWESNDNSQSLTRCRYAAVSMEKYYREKISMAIKDHQHRIMVCGFS
ncbi:unnamed protein product [Pleuronectes platessa]|uniref:Uncharacterized protein n=1 Tax=Pleuronectes platessa TaxID=8262 RepID=A0A9N7Y9E7_PLEPL|nr:unnamed protein product [Pleuronectes platessa]